MVKFVFTAYGWGVFSSLVGTPNSPRKRGAQMYQNVQGIRDSLLVKCYIQSQQGNTQHG